jgi:hypothetical protein
MCVFKLLGQNVATLRWTRERERREIEKPRDDDGNGMESFT